MNEQTQLLLKDAEYLTCPEAELIPDGARLTALINLVRKLAEAVPTAYTAGLSRGLELLPKERIIPLNHCKNNCDNCMDSIAFNSCRSQASSAINEEINKSKI